MPHKRPKAAIRKALSQSKGLDLPPTLSAHANKRRTRRLAQTADDIPKTMYRILNAERIRAEHKFKLLNQHHQAPSSSNDKHLRDELKLAPGEKLGAFNKRVEETLRPAVSAAFKTARTKPVPKPLNEKPSCSSAAPRDSSPPSSNHPPRSRPIDFAPRPTKFPLTHVATEPPALLFKKPANLNSSTPTPKLPVSAAQKRLMVQERESAIKRYREMKERSQRAKLVSSE